MLQWTVAANAVIATSYLAIGLLILAGLVRERRLGFNPLGTATAFIFLTCAAGHGIHVEHYLVSSNLYALDASLWHQALADGLTVIPAIAYLAQRRRYGLVIRGPHALLDFQRRLAVAEALREVGQDIAAQTDLDAVLRRVVHHARALLGADYVAISVVDEAGGHHLQTLGARTGGWDEADWRTAMLVPAKDCAAGLAGAHRPVVIDDVLTLPATVRRSNPIHLAEGARTLLAVPIVQGDSICGSLLVAYRSVRRVSSEDISSAGALASQAMVAVESTRLIATLRQADRLKDEFLSAAAHELKTPVTTIQGWSELLLKAGTDTGRARPGLQAIVRQSQRIARLTEDLIAVAHLRPGPPALKREQFDLSQLAREVVAQIDWPAEGCRLRVLAQDGLIVNADRRLIGVVLGRLLENARRYSMERAAIDVEVMRADRAVVVSVRDQGVGIPADRQPHVFEPFYEPVPSGEPGYVGSVSLGLYLSKQIIQAHGGRIWFTSEPGRGSTFSFSLPAA